MFAIFSGRINSAHRENAKSYAALRLEKDSMLTVDIVTRYITLALGKALSFLRILGRGLRFDNISREFTNLSIRLVEGSLLDTCKKLYNNENGFYPPESDSVVAARSKKLAEQRLRDEKRRATANTAQPAADGPYSSSISRATSDGWTTVTSRRRKKAKN